MTERPFLLMPEWIATVEPDQPLLTNYALLVEGDRIADILPQAAARDRYRDVEQVAAPGHLVTPGLINLHAHAAMSLLRGYADDLGLHTWLNDRIWPAESRCVSPDFVHDGTLLGCLEMLLGGTTCVNDMYFYPEEVGRAARSLSMRASLGIIVFEFPSSYGSGPDDYLSKGMKLRDQLRDDPLVSFTVAPHAPYTVSDDSFIKIAALADELELPVHVHLHETAFEVDEAVRLSGERPIRRLGRLGLLGPRLIAVHAVHLDDDDIELFVRHGVSVAHCPHSNLKLGSGIAPMGRLLDSGINIGIGTDGSASNNQLDLLQEARTAALLAKGVSGNAAAFPASAALHAMTLGGAIALGLDDRIGSIRTGKQADLVMIDLNSPTLRPVYDPISQFVYAVRRSDISDVWIGGKHVVHRQRLVDPAARNALSEVVGRIPVWQNRISDAGH